jgi:uncharacterized protein
MKNFSRREFIKSLGLGALGASLPVHSLASAGSEDIEVTHTSVVIPDLPQSFRNLRIGFVSDLHFGIWLPSGVMETALSALKEAKADLIIFGGDYIGIPDAFPGRYLPYAPNGEFSGVNLEELPQKLYRSVASASSAVHAPLGVLGVYGNHDQWIEPKVCAEELTRAGVNFLVNKDAVIRRGSDVLRVTGVDDYWTGIPIYNVPKERDRKREVRLLVSHNPDYVSFLLAGTKADFDLALCGHTHGGQIKFPGIGAITYNVADRRFGEGLVKHPRAQVFTTRGVGYVELPFRLNCPPEVSILTLTT